MFQWEKGIESRRNHHGPLLVEENSLGGMTALPFSSTIEKNERS